MRIPPFPPAARLAPPVVAALLLAASVPPTAPPAGAQRGGERVELEPFLGDVDAAKAEARERNVPLMVHMVLEDEPANDAYRDAVLTDAELARASQLAVVLVANNGVHDTKQVVETDEDGEQRTREVCSAYPWYARCEDHQRNWDPLYFEFHDEDGALRCPQAVILLPDGKEYWRLNPDDPTAVVKEFPAALERAQKQAGPGITARQLVAVKRALSTGRRCHDGKLWADACRAWDEVLGILPQGAYADEARAGREAAGKGMQTEIDAAAALLVPGKACEGYTALLALRAEYEGLPQADAVAKVVKRAEKDKEIRDEVRACQLELEAEELLKEVVALADAGEERKAQRELRKLLGRKYGETAVARRARERFPEWAREIDGDG